MNRAVGHALTNMVRYVILRRFLQDIPPWISFRDSQVSAWLTPKGGHLRVVATPDLATWSPEHSTEYSSADVPVVTGITNEDYGDSSDEEMEDWQDDDGNSGEYSREEPPLNQPDILAVDNRHGVGHTTLGNTSTRDTCPHTCSIWNQNINRLGGRCDDKLEKRISTMIAQKNQAYCIQEMWQLHN